jgi:surface protein
VTVEGDTYTIKGVTAAASYVATFVELTPEPYAVLSENNTVLTFFYDNQKLAKNGMDVGEFTNPENRPWHAQRENITKVIFDSSFANCTSITSTLYWFQGCSSLNNVTGIENLKTDNVTNMTAMFYNCSSLAEIDLSKFNTANTINVTSLFAGCLALTNVKVTGINTANMKYMNSMFQDCSNLTSLDLSSFNTVNATGMSYMFSGCSALTTIYVGEEWSTTSVIESADMFAGCTSLEGGRGTAYDVFHNDASYARIDMAPNAPGYFTRKDQLMGDANDDGSITIADAVATVTNILGEATSEYFSQTKADMNSDSTIDIFDVTLIVNAVLAATPAPAHNNSIAAEDILLETQANSLTMGISGSAAYTAFQFDVTLPEGTTLEGVRLTNKATNHQLTYKKVGENTYRVVGLSMTNQQLSTANGRLVQLQLSGNADERSATMSNVLFVGQPATDATAIRNHVTDDAADRDVIYDLNGRYVGNDRQKLSKGIYIINHKKVNIK